MLPPPCIAAVNIAAVGADFTLTGFSKISAADKIAHWRIIADSSVLEKWNILGADTEYKFLNTLQALLWVLYVLCYHSTKLAIKSVMEWSFLC